VNAWRGVLEARAQRPPGIMPWTKIIAPNTITKIAALAMNVCHHNPAVRREQHVVSTESLNPLSGPATVADDWTHGVRPVSQLQTCHNI
jgi:hypothetical protein